MRQDTAVDGFRLTYERTGPDPGHPPCCCCAVGWKPPAGLAVLAELTGIFR
jgi:hypothetical protein